MLDEEHLKDAIETAANNDITLKLLWHFIEKSGCFRQGIAKDERTENYNRGYGDFGLYIRELLIAYAPAAYIKFIEEGVKEND
jgi:hypothetical protein